MSTQTQTQTHQEYQSQTQVQPQHQSQNIPANVPPPYAVPPTPPTPVSPEQKELMDILNELIAGAQELSIELATVPYELIDKHPELKDWYEASKRQVMTIKRLIKFLRSRRTG